MMNQKLKDWFGAIRCVFLMFGIPIIIVIIIIGFENGWW